MNESLTTDSEKPSQNFIADLVGHKLDNDIFKIKLIFIPTTNAQAQSKSFALHCYKWTHSVGTIGGSLSIAIASDAFNVIHDSGYTAPFVEAPSHATIFDEQLERH